MITKHLNKTSLYLVVACISLGIFSSCGEKEVIEDPFFVFETQNATNITENQSSISIKITTKGTEIIREWGIVFAQHKNPSTDDSAEKSSYESDKTEHTFTLDQLQPDTKYYARSFIRTDLETIYANTVEFTTGKTTVKALKLDYDNQPIALEQGDAHIIKILEGRVGKVETEDGSIIDISITKEGILIYASKEGKAELKIYDMFSDHVTTIQASNKLDPTKVLKLDAEKITLTVGDSTVLRATNGTITLTTAFRNPSIELAFDDEKDATSIFIKAVKAGKGNLLVMDEKTNQRFMVPFEVTEKK